MKTLHFNVPTLVLFLALAFVACEKEDVIIDTPAMSEKMTLAEDSEFTAKEAGNEQGVDQVSMPANTSNQVDSSKLRGGDTTGARSIVPMTLHLVEKHNVSCHGESDGGAEVSVSGAVSPVYFEWSNGQTGRFLEDVDAGAYSVFARDALGRTADLVVILLEPSPLSVELLEIESETCLHSGMASVKGAGGTLPYTYEWSTGATLSFVPLPAGTHSVTVTDGGGCKAELTIIILSVAVKPEFKFTPVDVITCKKSTVSVGIIPESFGSDYTYEWTAEDGGYILRETLSFPPSIIVDNPGVYTMRMTDTRTECWTEKSVEVKEIGPIVFFTGFAGPDKTIQMGQKTTLSLESFPRSVVRYQWSPDSKIDGRSNKQTITTERLINNTTFHLEIEDEFGCTYGDNIEVNVVKPMPYPGMISKAGE